MRNVYFFHILLHKKSMSLDKRQNTSDIISLSKVETQTYKTQVRINKKQPPIHHSRICVASVCQRTFRWKSGGKKNMISVQLRQIHLHTHGVCPQRCADIAETDAIGSFLRGFKRFCNNFVR